MSRRHASYQCFFQYWHLSRKQNYIDALNSKSKHLYKTICWLLVINILEFSDFTCCFFLKTGALKPLKHKLKPDKSKKTKKKAVFSAPAQTSNRPTWLRPSVWVPPLGTVVPGTHASRGPEGHDRSTHTHNNINDPNTQTKKKKAIFGCISTSLVNKCILFSVVWPAHIVLVCILYLRCPVLVVPYPFFNQPHQRRDVVELGFLENTWHTDKERIVRLHCLVPKFTDRLGEKQNVLPSSARFLSMISFPCRR